MGCLQPQVAYRALPVLWFRRLEAAASSSQQQHHLAMRPPSVLRDCNSGFVATTDTVLHGLCPHWGFLGQLLPWQLPLPAPTCQFGGMVPVVGMLQVLWRAGDTPLGYVT